MIDSWRIWAGVVSVHLVMEKIELQKELINSQLFPNVNLLGPHGAQLYSLWLHPSCASLPGTSKSNHS
jgi:hypothetical protein